MFCGSYNKKELKRQEVLEAINKGTKGEEGGDKEGAFLTKGFIQAITNKNTKGKFFDTFSGPVREINRLYQGAKELVDKIEEDPDVSPAKLFNRLNGLYTAARLGDYEVQLAEGKNKDDQEAVVEQMKADLTGYAELATNKFLMADYIDLRADVELAKNEMTEELDKGDCSRAKMFHLQYKLFRFQNRLANHTENQAVQFVEDKRSRWGKIRNNPPHAGVSKMRKLRAERMSFNAQEYKNLQDRDADEKTDLIDKKSTEIKEQLETSGRAKDKDTLEALNETQREEIFTNVTEVGLEIDNIKSNMEAAIEAGNNKQAMDLFKDLKVKQLVRQTELTKMESALAFQRKTQAIGKWKDSLKNIGLTWGNIDKAENTGLLASTKELFASHANWAGKRFKKFWAKGKEKLKNLKEFSGQAVIQTMDALDDEVVEDLRTTFAATGSAINRTRDFFVSKDARIRSENTAVAFNEKRWFAERRHGVWKRYKKRQANEMLTKNYLKRERTRKRGERFSKWFGAEDDKIKAIEDRRKTLIDKFEGKREWWNKKIEEKENPHMAWFWNELKQHVKETPESEVEAEVKTEGEEAQEVPEMTTPAPERATEARSAPTPVPEEETLEQKKTEEQELQEEADALFEQKTNKTIVGDTRINVKSLLNALKEGDKGNTEMKKRIRNLKIDQLVLAKVYNTRAPRGTYKNASGAKYTTKLGLHNFSKSIKDVIAIATSAIEGDQENKKLHLKEMEEAIDSYSSSIDPLINAL